MWCLKGREDLCVYILPNQKKSFGKSLSDIKLEGDPTISRLHAVVSVEPTEESETQYRCVINDVSKYGTFVIRDNKKRKLLSDKFVLKVDDIVQFGLKESTFVVLCHSFVIARSSLGEQGIKKLQDIAQNLKATLSETWGNFCTHLTVAESTLFTPKLACALASAKPVVTNAYWEAVDVAVKESKELPKIEDFLPKLREDWLKVDPRKFLPDEKRRTLFKGLSFIHFCAKQYSANAPLITTAGGKSCVYPTKRPLTPRDLTAKNAIVILYPASDSTQLTQAIPADYPIIHRKLQAVKRRMISDSEIPIAVLHCNTETYCNPKYDFATYLQSETPNIFLSNTIIENTQDIVNADTRQIKRKIIPETCDSPNNESVSKKVRSDESERNISGNITTTQNTDNIESKCKIIPETCDSQTSKKSSKSSYPFDESERKCMSGTNESNIAMNNVQNASNREMKCKMTVKTYDSQNNENISSRVFYESEQRYVSDTSRSNILTKIQNKSIIKNNYSSNEQKNISDSNTNNILPNDTNKHKIIPESCCSVEKNTSDIFSGKSNNKEVRIIPESCCSVEKNISDIFSGKSNNKEVRIISETCEFNEELVGNNAVTKKEHHIVELQEESMLQENEYGFQQQENSIVEKDNLNKNNDKFARWKSSKNAKTPHTVSINEINDSAATDINIKQGKENSLFEKGCSRVELQDSLKKQKLSPGCNSEKNQEDKRVKEDKIYTKDNKKEELRKTGGNKTYQNQGFTDKILRKDVPCGKKFIKLKTLRINKRDLRIYNGQLVFDERLGWD
ncbi:putative leucine-rich repeat-containing protein DDB_G0290503 isoform X1 [Temnothorax curvispinosus]|uniref:Leucine-rich repeat-containing protein DDB_G0290503 isoform X1 n=1 Tax=Temnothorax curvispinosus TaxID=300111 RepID=A0A6J1QUF4_9HYME|nr:putative leucine-rich repeat-containing protein DDB_G0290503 isoform X1 [Temnothorax curvispinosus]